MHYKIIHTAEYAVPILKTFHSGIVHSVYRRTVNLSLGNSLLALQSASSPLSPISLITEPDAGDLMALGFPCGQPVSICSDAISIGSYTFSYGDAVVEDLRLKNILEKEQIQKLKTHIKCAIDSAGTGGLDEILRNQNISSSPALSCAAKHMKQSYDLSEHSDYEKAAARLCSMIGLGAGLTPSGDDFLCGVLAGLTLAGKNQHPLARSLQKKLPLLTGCTNDISAAFLTCAIDGYYSQAVNDLQNIPSAPEILKSFLKIGHSSGIDTLCGVLYALELPLD